jgi:HSP20 family protein
MARELSKKQESSQNVERRPQGSRPDIWPTTYSPFSMMRRFAEDMDRMFGGFGFPSLHRFSPWNWGDTAQFSPDLEVFEREGKLIVRADLPGLSKDDVKVDVSDHSLTVEGERKSEHEKNEEGVYSCERSYGHFYREIPLPEGVKTDTAKANFKNGVLEVTFDVPKTAQNRHRIQINEETASGKKGETAA